VSTDSRLLAFKEGVANEDGARRLVEVDASFDEFVSRGSVRLLRSAYLLTGDRAQAEDLLQVALVRTARRWQVARGAPDAYAYRVLVNLVRDHRRWLSRHVAEQPLEDYDGASWGAGDALAEVLERDAMIRAVKRLAPRQREVLVLRFFADLSVAETAAVIGSSQGTVKTHTSRALARLREVLADGFDLLTAQPTEVPDAD
jgi:RNA polymerase sigma-70 factor (sigma-E family)